MTAKRFEERPRPLTRDEAEVARDVIGQPVTPSWLGQATARGPVVLRPPALTRSERRRGFSADLTRWDVFAAPGLDDSALFAATLRASRRWQQRQR